LILIGPFPLVCPILLHTVEVFFLGSGLWSEKENLKKKPPLY
jgi:hypothetical protein